MAGLENPSISTVQDVFWPIYKASSAALGDREMETAISCTKCSQVTGVIHTKLLRYF